MTAHTVDAGFAALDSNLNLDPKVRSQASAYYNDVTDVLEQGGCISGHFLQGSYARKTMLKPLKDIDIICLLPDALRDDLDGPDGPAAAMAIYRSAVAANWPYVLFDAGDKPPAGKALRVTFPDLEFTVDLVPAFDTATEDVLIGDRFERSWTPSNSRRQIRRVRERNQATDGRFVHQVRELKSMVRQNKDLDFIDGIVVESLAFATITSRMRDKQATGLALSGAVSLLDGPVFEPGGDDDITAKWTYTERHAAKTAFVDFDRRAKEALSLELQGDVPEALRVWASLFGGDFPSPPGRPADEFMATWGTGATLTSAGGVSATRAGRQPVPPTRSWCSD